MNVNIGKVIASLRKKNNLTQDQLAEYLNVSNAAISKWENNVSYPDFETIPLIAKMFNVSIDTLFEYDINNVSVDDILAEASNLSGINNIEKLVSHLEDALQRFPNNFKLNLLMAKTLFMKFANRKNQDNSVGRRALVYYDRALVLDINEEHRDTILQNKSSLLSALGNYEEANEILQSLGNNKYTIDIANNLIKMDKFDLAANYLQRYLDEFMFSFAHLASLLNTYYLENDDDVKAYQLQTMVAQTRHYMADGKAANYYDFLCSRDFIDLAIMAHQNDDFTTMWDALGKAVHHATKFDLNPSFLVSDVNFLETLSGEYYNGNVGASKHIAAELNNHFSEFSDDDRFLQFIANLDEAIEKTVLD